MRVFQNRGIGFTRLLVSAVTVLVAGLGIWLATDLVSGHGTCRTHHEYRVYDGTHDGDGDGVGCETLPEPPGGPPSTASSTSSTSSTSGDGYDRDNWSFYSSSARAALICDSSEHVDHIVALKEAYDSGAATWTNTRKSQFANDRENLWCLDASVNRSKSDHDLAEWSGGTCEQRKHIATVTRTIKARYSLNTDAAEAWAIAVALSTQCSTSTPTESTTASDALTSTSQSTPQQPTPADPQTVDESEDPFPASRIVAWRCPDGMEPFTSFNYHFGQENSDGSVVSETEWSEFLAYVVTPRFPNGLTVFDAQGQWLDTVADRLYREGKKVLNILVPSEATADAKQTLDEIADVYVERFGQQAVFKTSVPACAGF